jgi:hypothetical protein
VNDPNDHQAKEVAPAQPSTVTLRVDETQLSQLLENLKAPAASKLDLKDLASLIQVLALVVGGAWALYEFLTFRSEQNRLTLDQQRFAVQQQGLSTRMAELSLSLQKRQEELAGLQLGKAHESRYRLDTGARALLIQHRKDSDEVWIEYTFKITNISDQEFRVTYSVLEVFRGKLAVRLTNEAPIIPVNPPPNLYVAPEPGGVRWQRIHGEAHAYDKVPDRALGILKSAGYKPIQGGGGTFVLKAGESSRFQEDFVIRATPDALIGFVINWGMDFGYEWNARSYGLRELLSQPQSQRALLPPA